MENKILDKMDQKISFILSAVSGTKENITQKDVDTIAVENEVLAETLEAEGDILYNATTNANNDIDDMLVNTLSFKLVNNVLIGLGEYNDADPEEFNAIALNSTIDEEDIELLIKRKSDVLALMETHKDESYYKNLISTVEEYANAN